MAIIIQKLWSTFDASFSDNNPPITQSIFQISILNRIISLYFYRKSSHSISNENTFYNIFYFFLLQFHPFNSHSHNHIFISPLLTLFNYSQNISRLIYPDSCSLTHYFIFSNGIVEQSHLIKESTSKSVKFPAQRYQYFPAPYISLCQPIFHTRHTHQDSSWHTSSGYESKDHRKPIRPSAEISLNIPLSLTSMESKNTSIAPSIFPRPASETRKIFLIRFLSLSWFEASPLMTITNVSVAWNRWWDGDGKTRNRGETFWTLRERGKGEGMIWKRRK